jgi:hypothetical protein
VLYLVGFATIDSSCCGVGGLAYAVVPGFVVRWHYRRSEDGRPVSAVEPIIDEPLRAEIGRLIQQLEMVSQVKFLD